MKIALGADHGGYELKEILGMCLREWGVEHHDFGTFGPEAVDYPFYGKLVGEEVAAGRFDRGLVVCGTGVGISIAANKVAGIRCALCHDVFSARMSRAHNDANMLAMGGRVIGAGPAREILRVWLDTPFAGERHERRVNQIGRMETRDPGESPEKP